MSTVEEIQNEIIEEFSIFDDWMGKYEYIIDLGKNLENLDDNLKKEEFLIKGCQSRVWLVPEFKGNILHFRADSDAIITKGIVSLLLRVFNDHSPQEIEDSKLFFVEQIGLANNLSPTRANGLAAMIQKINEYAKAAKS